MTLSRELPQHVEMLKDRIHVCADPKPSRRGEYITAGSREPSDASDLTADTIVRLLTEVRAALTDLDPDATPEQLLDEVLHAVTRLLPGAEDASIAFESDGELHTVAVAGDTALAVDDIQRALGDGPSRQVLTERRVLRIADLLTEPAWAEFAPLAAEVGVRAVLACPLPMPRKRLGVLSVYAGEPAAFDAAAELVIPVFAARAAIAAAYADKVTHLHRAIESRQVIGQAVGILMERHRLSAKQAFDNIVSTSQQSHIKLRELALRISETGEEPNAAARREH
jgi:transcriptional regulator with GAF, ATPase, and Fis domain